MKIFYGWVVVGLGVVVSCIGMGTMMSLSVFLQPMTEAMGWTRTGISTVATLNFLFMGIGSFMWGAISDRFGARAVILCGGLLLGAGAVAASQATTLLEFQIVYGTCVGLAVGSLYVPLTAMTTRWFTRNRSLAVALVSAGFGLGTTIVAPLARWMIMTHDWRFAMLVLGLLCWIIILPAALLLRKPPAETVTASPTGVPAPRDMSVAQALRTPQFAAIAFANFACCAAHSGPIFHMVAYAVDCGVPAMAAATVLSVAGLSALSGRILCGMLADRTGARRTLIAGLALQALAVGLYMFTHDIVTFYAAAIVFGFSYGGVMPLYAILVREYFPGRIMGSVFGVVAMVSTLGMAIGAPAGGWLFDHLGGYAWLYLGSSAIGLAAVFIAMTVRPPALVRLSPNVA